MTQLTLLEAVRQLAEATQAFTDADLEQPWRWRAHDEEGARFVLLGTYHELRDLAGHLGDMRLRNGQPPTAAQRALGQYLAAFRDLQAVFLGVSDEEYGREPGPGDWPLRYVLGHTAGAQRHFFTLVHYGLRRQREGGDPLTESGQALPPELPDGETDRVTMPRQAFVDLMEKGTLAEMWAFYEALHRRALDEFATMSDEELGGPSIWWEGEPYSLQYRLHRFDAHLRQHTVQAEKTLAAIGRPPNEARRLLRLIYNALAEVEAMALGVPDLAMAEQNELADTIARRTGEVTAVVEQARGFIGAIKAGEEQAAREQLAAHLWLANAIAQDGVSAVLVATYYGRKALAEAIIQSGARLNIFEAAATGHLEKVQEAYAEYPGWVNEYSRDGYTPVGLAAFFGHEPVVRWLIEHGADVNAFPKNQMGVRPIHAAAANRSIPILESLLSAGADPNTSQASGDTPLHEAALSGNLAMAQLLLDHGADPAIQRADGLTPLDLARDKDHAQVTERLRSAANLEHSNA